MFLPKFLLSKYSLYVLDFVDLFYNLGHIFSLIELSVRLLMPIMLALCQCRCIDYFSNEIINGVNHDNNAINHDNGVIELSNSFNEEQQ